MWLKMLKTLKIYTHNDTFAFKGEDANNVYEYVNGAGARGSEWTTPIPLSSGKRFVFIIKNITAMEFDYN